MHDCTMNDELMAVRMVTIIWIICFQVSFFIIIVKSKFSVCVGFG